MKIYIQVYYVTYLGLMLVILGPFPILKGI